jgi:hypothetical protein
LYDTPVSSSSYVPGKLNYDALTGTYRMNDAGVADYIRQPTNYNPNNNALNRNIGGMYPGTSSNAYNNYYAATSNYNYNSRPLYDYTGAPTNIYANRNYYQQYANSANPSNYYSYNNNNNNFDFAAYRTYPWYSTSSSQPSYSTVYYPTYTQIDNSIGTIVSGEICGKIYRFT